MAARGAAISFRSRKGLFAGAESITAAPAFRRELMMYKLIIACAALGALSACTTTGARSTSATPRSVRAQTVEIVQRPAVLTPEAGDTIVTASATRSRLFGIPSGEDYSVSADVDGGPYDALEMTAIAKAIKAAGGDSIQVVGLTEEKSETLFSSTRTVTVRGRIVKLVPKLMSEQEFDEQRVRAILSGSRTTAVTAGGAARENLTPLSCLLGLGARRAEPAY